MKLKTHYTAIALSFGLVAASNAATLITPTSATSSTSATDFTPVANIINNGGIVDASNSPIVPTMANYQSTHHQAGFNGISWVTKNYNPDYFANGGPIPTLTFDLGASYDLTDFVYWGYNSGGSGNEASVFNLTFSTDGVTYGNSVSFDQSGSPVGQGNPATLSLGSTPITAQYVRVEITDNQGGIDRVALGEVKFVAVPEPSSAALLGLGGLALLLRRRK